jgi:hypothetical protein
VIEYIISISVSLFIIGLVRRLSSQKGLIFWLFAILSILPPVIVAGVRDFSIGTDVESYVTTNFGWAGVYNNFFDYNNYIYSLNGNYGWTQFGPVHQTEFGYNVLVYFISRFTTDPHWLLFSIQFIISLFVLLSVVKISKTFGVSMLWQMFIYYFTFYLFGLNIMRQYMAAAIMLWAILLFVERKYWAYLVFQIIAISFHITSLIGIIIVILWWCSLERSKLTNYKSAFFKTVIFVAIIAVFGGRILLLIENIASLIPYLRYHLSSLDVTGGYVFRRMLVYILPGITIIFLISLSELRGAKSNNLDVIQERLVKFIVSLTLVGITLNTLYLFQNVIPRFAVYFDVFRIIGFILIIDRFKSNYRFVMLVITTFLGFGIFGYILYSGNGELFPYSSNILKELLQ